MQSLALNFPELLDALGKRLRLHINIQQGLEKVFFYGLLELSFYHLGYHHIHFSVPPKPHCTKKFSIKDSLKLKKFLMENFSFCGVQVSCLKRYICISNRLKEFKQTDSDYFIINVI